MLWFVTARPVSRARKVMRLHQVVPQIPPKSSVPPGLPFYKIRPPLTRPESTLLQVLIPLHSNSPRINTYKKPGRGARIFSPKVLQFVTTFISPCCSVSAASSLPISPLPATLTSHLQLAENKTILSPAVATLTDHVKHKPFVCHSYKKHPGWGYTLQPGIFSFRNLTTL
jgi:hypothetical protein